MDVIRPVPTTDTTLKSHSVAENDHPVWSNVTAYSEGDKVIRIETHRIYEALDATTGDIPEDTPLLWLELGPTNRWAMFDNTLSTSTISTSDITFVIQPGFVTSIGMIGIVGEEVTVTMRDAPNGTIVYQETRQVVANQPITNWWEWIVSDFIITDEMIFLDLPLYLNGEITITIKKDDFLNRASIAEFIVGKIYDLGSTEIGVRIGIEDFSRKETDDFGNAILIKRRFAKTVSVTAEIANEDLSGVTQVLFELRATPVLWIPSNQSEYGALVVYGFYRDFFVTVAYHTHSLVQIEIEGLT